MFYVIGDIHGRVEDYTKFVHQKKYTPSVQLGDLGISPYQYLEKVDSHQHRVLLGNHEHFEHARKWPHFLGDWGTETLGGLEFFYVRGALSIDAAFRVQGQTWWSEEELPSSELYRMLEWWTSQETVPDIVLTHTAPAFLSAFLVSRFYGGPFKASRTEQALQQLFEGKPPKAWYFGHHHVPYECAVQDCLFRCVAPGEVLRVLQDSYEPVSPRTH